MRRMGQRFVILRHQVNGGEHFDLMLEPDDGGPLRTFQLARWPLAAGETCAAPELPPHRRDYLDYEGPVSGNRGHVTRITAGTWQAENGDIVLSTGARLRPGPDGMTRLA
jgi:hypothetical protein